MFKAAVKVPVKVSIYFPMHLPRTGRIVPLRGDGASAVDHEVDKFVDVFLFVSDDLKLRNLTV